MQWEVTGADRTTGDERSIVLEAETEDSAIRRGNRRGLLVSHARPLDPADSVAGTNVPSTFQRNQVVDRVQQADPADYVSFDPAPVYSPQPAPPSLNYLASQTHVNVLGHRPTGNGVAVAALVVSLIAVVGSVVPILGCVAIPIGVVGLILGIVGVIVATGGKRSGLGVSIASSAISLVAIVLPLVITAGLAAVGNKVQVPPPRTSPNAAQAPTVPTTVISATQLSSEYSTNEVAADERYKKTSIRVTGVVRSVSKDIMGRPQVILQGAASQGLPRDVQCVFPTGQNSEVAKVNVGDTVSITGTCDGLMMNVLISNSAFVP